MAKEYRAYTFRFPYALRSLRHPNYLRYWLCQGVSSAGTWMQTLAQSWLIYRLTDSALMLGLVNVVGLLPVVPVSLVAGVINDRFSKRRVMLAANAALMLQTTVMALLIWYDAIQIWHVIVFSFGIGVMYAFEQPAHLAVIHELVSKDDIPNAFALDASVRSVTRMLGPLLAGVLIAVYGEAISFTANALSYVPLLLLLVWLPDSPVIGGAQAIGGGIIGGLRYIWTHQRILRLLATVTALNFFTLSFMTLLPAFADEVLGADAVGLGYLMGAAGGGAVLGAAVVASVRSARQTQLLAAGVIAAPALLILFAFAQSLPVAVALVFIVSIASTIGQSTSASQLQINVDSEFQGRVMSVFFLLFSGASRMGALAIGSAAELSTIATAIASGAALGLLSALAMVAWSIVQDKTA